jgi:hypothetical protein
MGREKSHNALFRIVCGATCLLYGCGPLGRIEVSCCCGSYYMVAHKVPQSWGIASYERKAGNIMRDSNRDDHKYCNYCCRDESGCKNQCPASTLLLNPWAQLLFWAFMISSDCAPWNGTRCADLLPLSPSVVIHPQTATQFTKTTSYRDTVYFSL